MANLPDPSTLTDEELDKILAGEELEEDSQDENLEDQGDANDEDDSQEEAKDESDKDSEDEDEADEGDDKKKPQSAEAKKSQEDEDEGKPPSRREQLRIQQILKKYGQPTGSPQKPDIKGIDYDQELNADDDTKKKLREDRESVAAQSFDQGLEQAKSIQFRTFLEIDAPRVEAKYPQLDKNSPEFKQDAANDVNLLYLQLAGYDPETKRVENPDFRYGPFVETVFALVNDLASQKADDITKNVKKRAAKTGLRPDGSSTKKLNLNKAPENMTDEELDAYLAQAIPS